MAIDARLAYVENDILQADPIRLVRMLYGGAIDAVAKARVHLHEGEIAGRSRQITKATNIVNELMLSLDRERGGEIAANLAELYDYLAQRLQNANFRQIDEPLAEVERLLTTLLEGWDKCTALPESLPSNARPSAINPTASPIYTQPFDDFPTYGPPRLALNG